MSTKNTLFFIHNQCTFKVDIVHYKNGFIKPKNEIKIILTIIYVNSQYDWFYFKTM
jgi:hypothetical protein